MIPSPHAQEQKSKPAVPSELVLTPVLVSEGEIETEAPSRQTPPDTKSKQIVPWIHHQQIMRWPSTPYGMSARHEDDWDDSIHQMYLGGNFYLQHEYPLPPLISVLYKPLKSGKRKIELTVEPEGSALEPSLDELRT